MLEGLLADDVPQLPREVAMLTRRRDTASLSCCPSGCGRASRRRRPSSMVATEMTSRTAVDAAGALWAAGVFAHVIGFGAGGPTVPPVPRNHARSDVTRPAPAPPYSPPPGPALSPPGTSPPVFTPPTRQDPGFAYPAPPTRQVGQVQQGDLTPTAAANWPASAVGATTGSLAAICAAATGVTVVLLAFWTLTAVTGGERAKDWAETLPLLAGGIAITVVAARGRTGGGGIAAALGLTLPAIALAIYTPRSPSGSTNGPASKRYFVAAASVLALLAAFAAAVTAVAGLARSRTDRATQPDGLSIAATIAGLGFVLSNIVGQDRIDGFLVGNVLGPGVRDWYVLWGLVFLAVFAIPPVIASFLKPGFGPSARPMVRLAAAGPVVADL